MAGCWFSIPNRIKTSMRYDHLKFVAYLQKTLTQSLGTGQKISEGRALVEILSNPKKFYRPTAVEQHVNPGPYFLLIGKFRGLYFKN